MLVPVIAFWVAWAMVIYTYLAFPILLALIARLRTRRENESRLHSADDALPRVAMVVAAFNEAQVMAAKLENCWKLDYPADRFPTTELVE